jgi:thioredoxin 1
MSNPPQHPEPIPTRDQIDQSKGPLLLEFGASWCPHCQALAPQLAELLETRTRIRHIKIEDGPGQPLGRSFRVKLWPNLVFLQDGAILHQLARPQIEDVRQALQQLTTD